MRVPGWTSLTTPQLWAAWRALHDNDETAVARAVWLCNRMVKERPYKTRRKFYRIKDQFLRRQDSSGRRVRHEVQACYSCDGDDPLCERCEGTGVYRERWLYTHAFTVGGVVYRMHSYTEPKHLLPGFGDDLESYGTAVSPTEYAELPLPFSPLLKMLAWVAATQWGMESGGNRYQSPPMDVRHYWVGL